MKGAAGIIMEVFMDMVRVSRLMYSFIDTFNREKKKSCSILGKFFNFLKHRLN